MRWSALAPSPTGEGLVTGRRVNTAFAPAAAAPVNSVAGSNRTLGEPSGFSHTSLLTRGVKGNGASRSSGARSGSVTFRLGPTSRTLTRPIGRDWEGVVSWAQPSEQRREQASCSLVTYVGSRAWPESLCAELVHSRPIASGARHVAAALPAYGENRILRLRVVKAIANLRVGLPSQFGVKPSGTAGRRPRSRLAEARLAPLVGAAAEPASREESFSA